MRSMMLLFIVGSAALVGACRGPLEDAVTPTLTDITAIQNSTTLTAQEQRAALLDLGLAPDLVNGLLRSVRTANQFGGDLRTAYDKVVAGEFTTLTPDEVQLYGDAASANGAQQSFTLTDVQAQAMVDFFQANQISTKDELLNFLDDPAKVLTISTAIPAGALNVLFVTFDPALLIPVLP